MECRPAFTEDEDATSRAPFSSLEGKIHPRTLSALTVRPFKFKDMSVVQARVLGLLPGLVGKERGSGPNEEGKRDLLVKVRSSNL